jgi:hypothetical protein
MTSCFVTLPNGIIIDAARPRGVQISTAHALGPHGTKAYGAVFANGVTADLNWSAGPFTALIWAALPTGGSANYYQLFGRYNYVSESVNQGWFIQWRPTTDASKGYCAIILNNNAVGFYSWSSGNTTYTDKDIMLGMSSDGSASKSFYINGGQVNTTGAANLHPASATASIGFDNSVYLACTWTRRLALAEVFEFYANPFGLLSYPEDSVAWIANSVTPPAFTAVNRRTLGPRVGSRSVY